MQVFRRLTGAFSRVKECVSSFHTSTVNAGWANDKEPKHFLHYNNVVYPPQQPGEEPRLGYVCHQTANIKYSPKKMWYIACMVRGLTVDEALKQLSFLRKKGSYYAHKTILEAQELAIKEHNVEFKSNLWVAESFSTKGVVIKGMRRHARNRIGQVRYMYTHYFVRLEEGTPPKDYYLRNPRTPQQQLDDWLQQMRQRRIVETL